MTDDPTDRALLDLLRRNARLPAATLARRLGMSRTTLQGRMDRLERQGAILGYTISEPASSDPVRAFVMITINARRAAQIERDLRGVEGLRELHAVSGPSDLIGQLGADSPESLDQVIDTIGTIEGVERTHSAMILSTKLGRN
ncbi:Lrp/AsnC family transcriptional regulator [Brytella acorum]|uniref:Lrp/AsnC family transcriptional regulator n=1 Tax=Brytella acorum TaxID=2959299 RepID=A0AA35V5E5_9PROT|nr:Lrp/AsnC family transcriptional regulator [Brytella acorum]MDF3624784.1 Lrp/AsnC family transcriptional regulator [Brytella acorum]CAI9120087.1 Lrp/AsnC family transcriptional regulator [Brytella acorum]